MGATLPTAYCVRSSSRFNPRTRDGCDQNQSQLSGCHYRFNPRTRDGCDDKLSFGSITKRCFNPRTRDGCDCCGLTFELDQAQFQSTHP